jgi:hypothetical protein
MPFLRWLEALSLSVWIREGGSIWGYPTILFLHTVGLGFLAGLSVAMALRILGVASRLPLAPFAKFFPLMWIGFWVNAISGILLLMADATTKAINPVFYIKIGFTLVACLVLILLHRRFFNDAFLVDQMLDQKPVSGKGKAMAAILLICWAGAITAGRLMAYIGPVAGLPGTTNHL